MNFGNNGHNQTTVVTLQLLQVVVSVLICHLGKDRLAQESIF